MGGQRQAAQGVPACPPVPDLRLQLLAQGWCQCHLRCSNTQVLATLNHALRSTLWEEIDTKEKDFEKQNNRAQMDIMIICISICLFMIV